jgi:hypothetical protein
MEPNEILWENLGQKGVARRRLASAMLVVMVLLCAYGVIFTSSYWKKSIKNTRTNTTGAENHFLLYLQSIVPSILIVCINVALQYIIAAVAIYEKHRTFTDLFRSKAVKLGTTMFINTALIAPVVYWGNIYGADGLIIEVYNIVIANAIFSPLLQVFSPLYIYRRLR